MRLREWLVILQELLGSVGDHVDAARKPVRSELLASQSAPCHGALREIMEGDSDNKERLTAEERVEEVIGNSNLERGAFGSLEGQPSPQTKTSSHLQSASGNCSPTVGQ